MTTTPTHNHNSHSPLNNKGTADTVETVDTASAAPPMNTSQSEAPFSNMKVSPTTAGKRKRVVSSNSEAPPSKRTNSKPNPNQSIPTNSTTKTTTTTSKPNENPNLKSNPKYEIGEMNAGEWAIFQESLKAHQKTPTPTRGNWSGLVHIQLNTEANHSEFRQLKDWAYEQIQSYIELHTDSGSDSQLESNGKDDADSISTTTATSTTTTDKQKKLQQRELIKILPHFSTEDSDTDSDDDTDNEEDEESPQPINVVLPLSRRNSMVKRGMVKRLSSSTMSTASTSASASVSSKPRQKNELIGMHISLSKPFFLQYQNIDSFMERLKKRFETNFDPFYLYFERVKEASASEPTSSSTSSSASSSPCQIQVLLNQAKSRSFLTLPVAQSSTTKIIDMIHATDDVLAEYNMPSFYPNPKIHVSIASAVGNLLEHQLDKREKKVDCDKSGCGDGNGSDCGDGQKKNSIIKEKKKNCDPIAFHVKSIQCDFGTEKKFTIDLKGPGA